MTWEGAGEEKKGGEDGTLVSGLRGRYGEDPILPNILGFFVFFTKTAFYRRAALKYQTI